MAQELQQETVRKKVMKGRGRPRKAPGDDPNVRSITKAIRLTDEELKQINERAALCKMNFSEYVRKVLIGYKPSVPDPKLKDELWAARTDIRNFANVVSGKLKGKSPEERMYILSNNAVLREWGQKLVPLLDFLDNLIKK